MYAIVEIAGQQFKVEEGKKIFVHRLDNEQGENLEFDRVLLVEDNETILVGEPTIADYIVEGKVLEHVRGDKLIVFKKKRKKGYRVKNGHRQNFT
ncbi:MAG: 50S ribosomal protein L21, partial [Bacteroidales bacterium]